MNTGADGRRFLEIAHSVGFRCEVIPTHSFGSLRQNAQIVGDWLSSRAGGEIVLVSLSKAAAEVDCLLRDEDAFLFRDVTAVLNLSPMMFGSPLVDRVLDHPLRRLFVRGFLWCKNYDFATLAELRYNPDIVAAHRSSVPILNVIGFPMERHLSSSMARRQYGRLRHYGPNDGGGVLIADAVHFPGALLPVWAADHYLRYPEKLPDLLGQALCTVAMNDRWARAAGISR